MTNEIMADLTKKYLHNMKIIDNDKSYDKTWKETNNIYAFNVKQLLNSERVNKRKYAKYIISENGVEDSYHLIGVRPLTALAALAALSKIVNSANNKPLYKLDIHKKLNEKVNNVVIHNISK